MCNKTKFVFKLINIESNANEERQESENFGLKLGFELKLKLGEQTFIFFYLRPLAKDQGITSVVVFLLVAVVLVVVCLLVHFII